MENKEESIYNQNDASSQPTSIKTQYQPNFPNINMERPELVQSVKKQIEFYFSKENLLKDNYLLSQMDSNHYVNIQVIASFNRLQRLTNGDISLIIESIDNSSAVQFDETRTKIRPIFITQRNTLILRDVPDGTRIETLEELFKTGEISGVESIKPDIANTWFITFLTEDDARNGLSFIRNCEISGQPIYARLKTETLRPAITPVFIPQETNFEYFNPPGYDSNYNDLNNRKQNNRGGGRKMSGNNSGGYKKNDGGDRRRPRKRDTTPPSSQRKPFTPVAISPTNFPPLPNKKSELKTYSKTEIINVLDNLDNLEKPPEALLSHSEILNETPNKNLASSENVSKNPLLTSEISNTTSTSPTTIEKSKTQSWSSILSEPPAVQTQTTSTTSTSVPISAKNPHRRDRRRNDRKRGNQHNSQQNNSQQNNSQQNNSNNNNSNQSTSPAPSSEPQVQSSPEPSSEQVSQQ